MSWMSHYAENFVERWRDEEVSDMHEFEGKFIHATDSAALIDVDGREVWFPLQQIELEGYVIDYAMGDDVEFKVPEWLAVQKGLF